MRIVYVSTFDRVNVVAINLAIKCVLYYSRHIVSGFYDSKLQHTDLGL